MNKKIILIIITFLFLININEANAAGYCKYEAYDGAVLTVYETGSGAIGYLLDEKNANEKTYMRNGSSSSMEKIYKFDFDLDGKDFYKNGEFFCKELEILKNFHVNIAFGYVEGVTITFTSSENNTATGNGDVGYYDKIKSTSNGKTDRLCYFNYQADNKHKVALTLAIGNNELNINNIGYSKMAFQGTATKYYSKYVNIEDFLDSNGVFGCKNTDLKIAVFKSKLLDYGFLLYTGSDYENDRMKSDRPDITGTMNYLGNEGDNLITGFEQGTLSCDGIFAGRFGALLKTTLNFVKFLVPIIIIGMTIIDYIKAIVSQDSKEITKASQKLIKRIIIGVIIFLLPTILELVLDLADIPYGTCNIK